MFSHLTLTRKLKLLAVFAVASALFASCGVQTAETTSRGVNLAEEATTLTEGETTTAPTTRPTRIAAEAEQDNEESSSLTQQTLPDEGQSEAASVDVWAMNMHPNGSQLVVTNVALTSDATIVTGTVINGRDFRSQIRFDDDDSVLRGPGGETYALLEGADFDLEHGASASYQLVFEPIELSRTPRLTMAVNVDDDSRDLDEGAPGFTVADIDLTTSATAPPLPQDVPIDDSSAHPTTATVRVEGVSFSDTHIGVGFVATNGAGNRRSISGGHHASFLEDDLGNRYWLKFDGDERFIRVDAGSEVRGVLVFAGRIDPAAKTLTLVLNVDESTTDDRSLNPKFVLGPWPLDGSFVATSTERAPITIDETQTHPNTSQVTLNSLTFNNGGTIANVSATNPRRVAIRLNGCCDDSYLLDDLGNRYVLLGPADNESVKIDADSGIEGDFSFAGRIDEDATTVQMVLGDRDENGLVDPDTSWPQYRFGPYQLRVQSSATSSVVPPSNFGSTSQFSSAALETSTSTEAALIFSEFSGVEIPGGVLLTLPEGILFDSGQSQLRSGATASIDKIVQILEFYTGDDVIVVGHTDSEGSEAFNLGLSTERAEEVQRALVRAGAAVDLLSIDGRGESQPVASNDSEAGRADNRRVEIMIMTTKGLPE